MNPKKLLAYVLLSGGVLGTITSCDPKDGPGAPAGPKAADIVASPGGTGNRTLYADTVYTLSGFVFVNPGQTLTIQPGTVIKAKPGQQANASALIVAKGATIVANGTREKPIIFTAEADDVANATDLDVTARGLWGGIIILGDAPINTATGQANIEGLPTTELRGIFGGPNSGGNSGSMQYVSIRHGGTNIGAGNEINGLTLGGVGSGTKISFIEVYGNDDDGIEWFGGTVNTNNLAAIYCQDDAFDWDFGFISQNQFWVGYQTPAFAGSDRGMELDGVAGNNLAAASFFSKPTVYNMTLIGQGNTGNTAAAIYLEEGTGGIFRNSIIAQFNQGIALGTKAGAGQTSQQRLGTDLLFQNNVWYQVADGTLAGIAGGNAAFQQHLEANGNMVSNPALGGTAAANFNPLPQAGGMAFTHPRAEVPAATNGFTYQAANYVGAFGTENWLDGWTAVDAYGLLK